MYPHTAKTPINFTAPDNLKGADMLMFEMFSSMALHIRFRPAVLDPQYSDYSSYLDTKKNRTAYRHSPAKPIIGKDLNYKFELGLEFDPFRHLETGGMYSEWAGKAVATEYATFDTDQEAPEMPAEQPGEAASHTEKQGLSEYISFSDIHWLNEAGHMEPQLSWIAVS